MDKRQSPKLVQLSSVLSTHSSPSLMRNNQREITGLIGKAKNKVGKLKRIVGKVKKRTFPSKNCLRTKVEISI